MIVILIFGNTRAQAIESNIDRDSIKQRLNILEHVFDSATSLLQKLHQKSIKNGSDIEILREEIQQNRYELNQIIIQQKRICQQINTLNNLTSKMDQRPGQDNRNLIIEKTKDLVCSNNRTMDSLLKINSASSRYDTAINRIVNKK
ncbi:tol-pal system YbgF family protein [Candidatus Pantoea carbekii]|nr:hypothetical protein [Candidatus Pantoea carbekii]